MPYAQEKGDNVLVSDPWQSKIFLLQRAALLDLLTDGFLVNQEPSPEVNELVKVLEDQRLLNSFEMNNEDRGHVAHWWRRGWSSSLEYYLRSRDTDFYDQADANGDLRRDTIRSYLEVSGPPPTRAQPQGVVPLPSVDPLPADVTLGNEIMERRTIRGYVRRAISAAEVSNILWHGLGGVREYRGAQVPDDIIGYLDSYGVAFDYYLVVYAVNGIEPGIYYYAVERHALSLVKAGEFREEMTNNLFGQTAPKTAAVTVVFVADFLQYAWRYRHERALRNLYIDVGRIAQDLLLIAGVYKLGSFMTPALRDQAVSTLLALDSVRQAPIYSLTMGLRGGRLT